MPATVGAGGTGDRGAGGAGPRGTSAEHDPLQVFRRLNAVEFDEQVIGTILWVTIWITVDSGRPDLAEVLSRRLSAIDDEYGELAEPEYEAFLDGAVDADPYENGPVLVAQRQLIGFLQETMMRSTDDLEGRVVHWVSATLGRSCPAIDRMAVHLGGPIVAGPLAGDLLAALIWLASGTMAVSDDPEIVRWRRCRGASG